MNRRFFLGDITIYIYYLIILGGKDYMDNDEKVFSLGDIRIDSWCVVGIGGATGSDV
jgi:hypothetical protein